MRIITTNYGLAGGMLDATVHVERELQRQMTAGEIACRRCEFEVAVVTQPGRANADRN